MSPIDKTPVVSRTGTFPHVGDITDWNAQQSVRLLWQQKHDLEARLQAAEATLTSLVDGHNANEVAIATATSKAQTALALAQQPGQPPTSDPSGGGGGGGGGGFPGGGDHGDGQTGCAACGMTGHDTGGLLNAIRAGQIACGTANEFVALLQPVATSEQREANIRELRDRIIWHLRLAGFSAGQQRNPSGTIGAPRFCVVVDGVTRVYKFVSGPPPSEALVMRMTEDNPPDLVDFAGIPD